MLHRYLQTCVRAITTVTLLGCTWLIRADIGEGDVRVSSLVGGAGDTVNGVRIQADGSLILAANISDGPLAKLATGAAGNGIIVRLSPEGKPLSALRLARQVRDLAIDGQDNIYVAAGLDGAFKLDRLGNKILWKKDTEGPCVRIDASADGHCAALRYGKDDDSTPGAGLVYIIDPSGKDIGNFKGRHNTLDVAIDGKSQTVITIGWRQANAFDGKKKEPVQIAHLTGRGYDGTEKYHLYDWSVDTNADNFINKATNNMADTRGYRCALGADGKVVCAFEAAGGNHIFRYEPTLLDGKFVAIGSKKAKGDQYHNFANSRSEHKTVLSRYEPGTGACLQVQEFTGRLPNGKANAVRVKDGAVAGQADGSVLLSGTSASGLPITFNPPGTGDYIGGGFVLRLTPGLDKREFCLRIQPGALCRAVDSRKIGNKTIIACGGTTSAKEEGFWLKNSLQTQAAPASGFVWVLSLP